MQRCSIADAPGNRIRTRPFAGRGFPDLSDEFGRIAVHLLVELLPS
jgi:hypothetical protein